MESPIRLIVGLGNPGDAYAKTRHNAGAWFVAQLAHEFGVQLRSDSKFFSAIATVPLGAQSLFLLIPTTFMNASGKAVRAVSQFYQIPPESILVAHDELDFPPGVVKLKKSGGHGGHNGLRDIIQHLQTPDFVRLRLGIGHPGDRAQVHDYVLSQPSKSDHALILQAIANAQTVMPEVLSGALEHAMQKLHTE